ncbi:cilia- and flagella-associated protein 74 isoform X2 [Hemicordylus capensis]|uniref:cilia- and flagella-associated protein 74 isoform X2 n=1 Tax=Hemicordylus capensis TaxID=884348 RepID=UPI0023048C46|nr:cilia- and flagella-associated protein 74 isoform X2 [Hemicordylus capensis]
MSDMESPSILEENLTPPDLCSLEEENEEEEGEEEEEEEEEEDDDDDEESILEELAKEEEILEGLLEEEYKEEINTLGGNNTLESTAEDFSGQSMEVNVSSITKKPMTYHDRVRILNLRRNLNQLDKLAKEKEMIFRKTREELNACHARIEMLVTQQKKTEREIQSAEEAGNTAVVFRLQAMHRRLCGELENEKDLQSKIAAMLNENVLELWKIEIEQGNFSDLRKEITQDEEDLEAQRQKHAEERLKKQKGRTLLLGRRWLNTERKVQEANEEYEQGLLDALEEDQRNHQKAVSFLKKSLARVHEKEAAEEAKQQEHLQRRMETVISLKTHITASREHLHTLQAQDRAKALEAEEQEQKMLEQIQAEGHNVTREAFLLKRQAEFEKRKKEFEEQQKARKLKIVERILKEEAQQEKIKKLSRSRRPKREKPSDAVKWRVRTWQYIAKTCAGSAESVAQKSRRTPSPCSSFEGKGGSSEDVTASSPLMAPERQDREEEEGTLAEPEFVGIWDQEFNISDEAIPDDRTDSKPLGATKLEKEIYAQNLEKLRRGFIRKHRVSGLEYTGRPFYSKPSIIHFKDFDIGKTYKKKMVLINAFYSINYCKLGGVSEHLKDFFTVDFDPPGPMSSGMSCEVGVTFKPMINEELEGEITFLSQIGSFSIPLKCSTKKCVLALDKELIDFGTHVVGETISRTITLTNCGALGTQFQLHRSASSDAAHATAAMPSAERVIHSTSDLKSPGERGSGSHNRMASVFGKEADDLNRSEEVIQFTTRSESVPVVGHFEPFGAMVSEFNLHGQNIPTSLTTSPQDHPSREDSAEITLGKVTEGEIGPFSSVKLQIIFTPVIPGAVRTEFEITFDHPDCKPLRFSVVAVSLTVPVWLPNPDVDLKICMYDRLYQDCIVVQSRATSALRLKFDVCKELANHLELLPKTGYIQAHSFFSVQLKFLPRQSLPEDAGKYFDKKTRVLQVPVTIVVADQSKPVEFTVHAIVTPSDVEISPTEINFGYCSIYEAVRTTITLTNKAILPQEFGFVGLPEVVEIQPNDGFGVLLPLERLELDIIFKANKAKEYSFHLTCKTEINRQFKLSCKAVGVHPPLELSHSLVQFSATALFGVSTATVFVINSHVSLNQFTHVVPRIGKGELAPVGPTSFQFLVPEDSPITILPCVGTVLPGKKCRVEVSFRPVLCDQVIRLEAVHLLCQAAEAKMLMEKKIREAEQQKKKEEVITGRKEWKKQGSGSFLGQVSKDKSSRHSFKQYEPPNAEDIQPDSEEYITARLSLIRTFTEKFEKYVIPCLVASGNINKRGAEDLHYSPYNTLYLELHCPAVPPSIMVTSNNGKTTFHFGDVAVGHRIKKEVQIQNIFQEELTLSYSLLNPYGPFLLVNPIKTLGEGESRVLVISFCPDECERYFEILEIRSEKTILALILIGQGVPVSISCSVEGDVFNMGYVVAKEMTSATFKIENTSAIPLKFSMVLESLSARRHKDQQKLPLFLESQGKTDVVGTQNYSGSSVFSVSPVEGTIGPGKSQEITVTFSPDHESLYYTDCLQIVLFGKEVIRVIQLKAMARSHIMFVEGGDPLDVPIESLTTTASVAEDMATAESDRATKSILLSLESIQSETFVIPAVRELRVGGIRGSFCASKKNVEFSWEGLQLLQLKGFTIDLVKGAVERGQTKTINVSWVPPAGSDAGVFPIPSWRCCQGQNQGPPASRADAPPLSSGCSR